MNQQRFLLRLAMITAGVLGILLLLQIFPVFSEGFVFSIVSLAFFALFSLGAYLLSVKAAMSKNKNMFISLVMAYTFVKLFLTLAIVLIYKKVADPEGMFFLIPFFIIYIVFTAFETFFLMNLTKIRAR